MLCVNQRFKEGGDVRIGVLKPDWDVHTPRLGMGTEDRANGKNTCVSGCGENISFPQKSGSRRAKGVPICFVCPGLF